MQPYWCLLKRTGEKSDRRDPSVGRRSSLQSDVTLTRDSPFIMGKQFILLRTRRLAHDSAGCVVVLDPELGHPRPNQSYDGQVRRPPGRRAHWRTHSAAEGREMTTYVAVSSLCRNKCSLNALSNISIGKKWCTWRLPDHARTPGRRKPAGVIAPATGSG